MTRDDFDQLNLFSNTPLVVRKRKLSNEEQFAEFHRLNPHVYEAMVGVALDIKRGRGTRRGRKKYSIYGITELVRWGFIKATNDPNSDYKINNNYRPLYARLIMEKVPELAGFFNTREIRRP